MLLPDLTSSWYLQQKSSTIPIVTLKSTSDYLPSNEWSFPNWPRNEDVHDEWCLHSILVLLLQRLSYILVVDRAWP